ncbi:Chloroperoxidase [Chaetomium tenue]|uniref:Chloroperoxidase n=1 Tax=Chaetomium tenue TaxID=1854479 RepID=A0ACB7PC53_9PEZI|nr:Chloroperoxidase [Chaetomium globosum]
MKLGGFASVALFSLAAAVEEPEGHEYHRNPADDRSPCPGLNVLANHGFLPRSGLNIDLETFRYAAHAGFNYKLGSVDQLFQAALDFKLSTTGNSSTIHLSDLAKHDTIEMDGSLSRSDFLLGDDLNFDPAIWHTVALNLDLYNTGPSEADKYVTVETAAKARAARVKDAMAANPNFNASEAQIMGSPGTTALYLTTLWDDEADAAPKAWIRAFFEEERNPYLEGYDPANRREKTFDDVTAMFARVVAVKTEPTKCKRKFRS